jgi:hypothetical protein
MSRIPTLPSCPTSRIGKHDTPQVTPCPSSPVAPIISIAALLELVDWLRKRPEQARARSYLMRARRNPSVPPAPSGETPPCEATLADPAATRSAADPPGPKKGTGYITLRPSRIPVNQRAPAALPSWAGDRAAASWLPTPSPWPSAASTRRPHRVAAAECIPAALPSLLRSAAC